MSLPYPYEYDKGVLFLYLFEFSNFKDSNFNMPYKQSK